MKIIYFKAKYILKILSELLSGLLWLTITHPSSLFPRLGGFYSKADGFKHQVSPQGSLTRRSWTPRACLNCRVERVQMNSPNRLIHNSDSSLNAQGGSKRMRRSAKGECWGSERRRVGEGKMGDGRGADIRRADFAQISLHFRDKGNNGFRWGELQRDAYHLPLHCERRITGSTEQREREALLARMWGDVSKCTPDNPPQKHICLKSYWTLPLSYLKKKKKLSSLQRLFRQSESILFTAEILCRHKMTVLGVLRKIWQKNSPCIPLEHPFVLTWSIIKHEKYSILFFFFSIYFRVEFWRRWWEVEQVIQPYTVRSDHRPCIKMDDMRVPVILALAFVVVVVFSFGVVRTQWYTWGVRGRATASERASTKLRESQRGT